MIREARRGDADALAGLQHRAWHRAYADFVDADDLGTLDERLVTWRGRLDGTLPEPARTTLVHDQDGQVAGFAAFGPARDADLGVGELLAIYVDPPAQGAGVGGLLLDEVDLRLRAVGHSDAVLWVFERNEHARHVYEQRGWVLEPGSAREDRWAREVRYRRAL